MKLHAFWRHGLGNTYERWFLVFIIATFFCALRWAVSRDSFERIEISFCPSTGQELEGMAVLPKPVGKHPVAFFLYGSRGSLLTSGRELRRHRKRVGP